VKIILVEDHVMFREVLRKICVEELGHDVVGETGDGEEALSLIAGMHPDLVLLDLHLPSLDGFQVAERIRKIARDIRILVLSSHCDEYSVFRAERVRVQGFVDKNTNSVAMLKTAIAAIAQGQPWFSAAYQRARAARLKNPQSFDKLLTDRERAILALVALPLTDVEIARRLQISEETVAKHRLTIRRKLDLETTTELVRYAREHGFMLQAPPGGGDALLP
jgi:DNA-binding NarL/FixJ family response regulator